MAHRYQSSPSLGMTLGSNSAAAAQQLQQLRMQHRQRQLKLHLHQQWGELAAAAAAATAPQQPLQPHWGAAAAPPASQAPSLLEEALSAPPGSFCLPSATAGDPHVHGHEPIGSRQGQLLRSSSAQGLMGLAAQSDSTPLAGMTRGGGGGGGGDAVMCEQQQQHAFTAGLGQPGARRQHQAAASDLLIGAPSEVAAPEGLPSSALEVRDAEVLPLSELVLPPAQLVGLHWPGTGGLLDSPRANGMDGMDVADLLEGFSDDDELNLLGGGAQCTPPGAGPEPSRGAPLGGGSMQLL